MQIHPTGSAGGLEGSRKPPSCPVASTGYWLSRGLEQPTAVVQEWHSKRMKVKDCEACGSLGLDTLNCQERTEAGCKRPRSALGGQKRVCDFPELQLQVAVSQT